MARSCLFALIAVFGITASALPASGQADPAHAVQDLEITARAGPDRVETSVRFRIVAEALEQGFVRATIRIYDSLGRVVSTPRSGHHDGNPLVDRLEYESAGVYEASWDGRDSAGRSVPSGLYFVVIALDESPPVRQRFEFRRQPVEL